MSQLHIPTNVVDTWKWWEFEEYIKRLNDKIEKEEQIRKEQDNQPNVPDYSKKIPNINSMMKNINKYK